MIFRHKIHCLLVLVLFLGACVNTKRTVYFYGIEDSSIPSRYPDVPEPIITSNDILSITISSANPEADLVFNAPNTSISSSDQQVHGYLVDKGGFIYFPFVGKLKATGLTKDQLKDTLTSRIVAKQLLVDPLINIRFTNFRVTIMGEVKTPGVVTAPDERLSLMEALGKAGDLTPFARKDNVLIIREEVGKKVIKRINLNDKDELFHSPYYYLKSNDIVFAEANAAKVSSAERSTQLIPYVITSVTLLVAIIGIVLR